MPAMWASDTMSKGKARCCPLDQDPDYEHKDTSESGELNNLAEGDQAHTMCFLSTNGQKAEPQKSVT
jgi:hypothetical protein